MPNWRGLIGAWLKPGATGARGERLAEVFLRRKRGYGIVARNWRNPRDRREEIDLVCCDGDVLVFVEVKARDAAALVPGYFAVDRRKKNVLRRACTAYLRSLREPPRTYRFDIVEVAFPSDGGEPEVNHFANIPLFSRFHRPR